jgi:hypothetical protein
VGALRRLFHRWIFLLTGRRRLVITIMMLAIANNILPHAMNWVAGWLLIFGGFVSGMVLGLRFHREDFWGGYASFRRRIVRLGHVAMVALGMLNVLFSFSPVPVKGSTAGMVAGVAWIGGAIAMPSVCFLTGWRERWRRLFPLPVLLLIVAVIATLVGGLS